MSMGKLHWFEPDRYWETISEDVSSADRVIDRLDELERRFWKGPQLCVAPTIELSSGDTMQVGLAGSHWLLIHSRAGSKKCSWAVSDTQMDGTIWVHFPADTEVSRQQLVPKPQAQRAIREWFEAGRLGGGLHWMHDEGV
jgi:hypothetical protein